MRYTIAAFAAFASLAAAVPGYHYAPESTPTPTPEYPTYPAETPKVPTYPESSKAPEYPSYPVSSKVPEYPSYPSKPSSKAPEYPSYPESSKVPTYPVSKPSKPEASCVSSVTVTVTVPYPTGTPGYPHGPNGPKPSGPSGYKPSGPAPYPVPSGTGYPPSPPKGTGYPTKTGGYTKPSTPAEFTGAASSLNAAGFVAGVGALAAFFL